MALKREFTFLSGDGATQIHGIEWKPESGKICGILQIFHGMVEYIERYEDFAEFLTEKGFLVSNSIINTIVEAGQEQMESSAPPVFR